MPFGRSDAGLEPFQSIAPPWFNACARSRVCNTLPRQSFIGVTSFSIVVAMPSAVCIVSAHRSQRMNPTVIQVPPTQQWYCRRRAGFPRLIESLARNADATSLSPVTAGNQVLALAGRPLSDFVNSPTSIASIEPLRQTLSSTASHRSGKRLRAHPPWAEQPRSCLFARALPELSLPLEE